MCHFLLSESLHVNGFALSPRHSTYYPGSAHWLGQEGGDFSDLHRLPLNSTLVPIFLLFPQEVPSYRYCPIFSVFILFFWLLRETFKIVLHTPDLIFHPVDSAVVILPRTVTILSPCGSLVNLPYLIHLSLYFIEVSVHLSFLSLWFCSNFIKTTLSLHLHEVPHKILKFSSGSRENTFQRPRHPLNFEQYSSFLQQLFSRGPKPFLEEAYKSTLIYSSNIS